MSRKPGSAGRMQLTLEERINIAEGEDSLSDSDAGLDMIKRTDEKDISLDDLVKAVEVDNDDVIELSSGSQDSKKRKRLTYGTGERVAFEDDEDSDAAYNAFKKRKSERRKKALASTKLARAKSANSSVIGRRSKAAISGKGGNSVDRPNGAAESENEDEALLEMTLPDYLQKRYDQRDERRRNLGDAGLRLPPSYDDVYFSDDERRETLDKRPKLGGGAAKGKDEEVELRRSAGIIPAPVARYLRDYQVLGVAFLHELFVYQKGGILGDDMGLGKTIQVIAFLCAAFGKTGDERDHKRMRKMRRMGDSRWYPRALIICPGGLMSNWRSEFERWGWWHVDTYHGSSAEKDAALAAASNGRLEIMITTYATYRLNAGAINSVRWDCVIADECHTIKEPKADITRAMHEVNALCRIGLTGTAIQNKLEEMWTVLNWTNPGRLGPLVRFKELISLPIKLGQSHDATKAQLDKSRRTAEDLVQCLLPRFFLRRMKSLIADQLPKKSDRLVFCPLTDSQAEAYNNFCDSELARAIRDCHEPCSCGSGKKQGWCHYSEVDGKRWSHYVFPCMQTLRKLANHVALLLPSGDADRERHDKDMAMLETALPSMWRELYQQRDSIMNYANTAFCGKWKILRKLLKFWHENGDKVLVFSCSVRLLKMLNMLFKATTSYNVSYLDGSMNYDERQQTVDDYNSDPRQFVFLISTRAGGVGLNITSANKVVVFDPNWNPSYDLQAQDRAYRIGQTRDVDVFRFVSAGTIEECVYARQVYKQQQANIGYNASVERRYFKGVQDQKDQKGEIFGLRNLFAPLSTNIKLREIINNTNIAETRAGVEIIGLEFEASQEDHDDMSPLLDDTKEDAAMSQLAAEIIDEPGVRRKAAQKTAKKKDPIQAILASAGVEYTHENAEVIGTSKIETKISSRARKFGNDIDLSADYAFARDQFELNDHTGQRRSPVRTDAADDHDADVDDGDLDSLGPVTYKYRPPADVRKRQFCTMAKQFGYDDSTEFALVVEGWTQEQRRNCLEQFYKDRRRRVAELK